MATEKLVLALADKVPVQFAGTVRNIAPFVGKVADGLDIAIPYVVQAYIAANAFLSSLPEDLLYSLFGLVLVFFGGFFPLTIAAFEALHQCGWDSFKQELGYLYTEYEQLKIHNEHDNKKDDNNNGVADISELSSTDVFSRKSMLYLAKVNDPHRISQAFGTLAGAAAGVIATLKLQFARTVSLGLSIGEHLKVPAFKYLLPVLKKVTPEEYQKWLPVLIGFVCKTIAVSIAWAIQKVLSAVQCASHGGLMFARHGLKYMVKKGFIKDVDVETTFLDEAIGWTVAGFGVWWQLRSFFSLAFPLSFLLLPASLCEWILQWVVTSE